MKKKSRKVNKFEWTESRSIEHPKAKLVFERYIKSDDNKRMWIVYEVFIPTIVEEI